VNSQQQQQQQQQQQRVQAKEHQRLRSYIQERGGHQVSQQPEPEPEVRVEPLLFYLAADSAEAYDGLTRAFPANLVFTRRQCGSERCDFRDCTSIIYALVDMMNLAHTRLILGSGYSSYSEVAAHLGGSRGKPLPTFMAGRDFGKISTS